LIEKCDEGSLLLDKGGTKMPAMSGSLNCSHCGKEGIHIIDLHYLGSNQIFRCSQCGYKFQVFSILPEGYADFGFDNIEGGVAFKIRFKNGALQQGFIENPNDDDIAQLMKAFEDPKVDTKNSYLRKWDEEKQVKDYLAGGPEHPQNENGIVLLDAISKEKDLMPTGRIIINPPPGDGRCDVCGRHISELKPFGCPGDPLVGDFSGKLLIKNFRPDFPLPDEIREVNKRAKKEEGIRSQDDFDSWYIANYSEDERKRLNEIFEEWEEMGLHQFSKSWECRDCIVLDLDEYFEKLNQRYPGHEDD
jgi:hypothetical protein